ncbi:MULTISPECIES: helix-turn-helix domain-containing protein [Paenibacillus]|uniref:HTH cro/C1-type domain-containing protein n=1 Tax=Paenibacillus solani TaxID=1705565 RepID=A0A0M1P2P0_9BACL|nr:MULTISPECIES: helix-turn-helix domain-containing protein [Paenibacillus]KOR88758.1 hypothetical protein AM231_05980 [Paenibacillus solani]MBX4149536.1 helix-turn-helix domain-containing protein [Paenibacillus lautus]
MNYSELLRSAVKESGWSYSHIVEQCKVHNKAISRSYLSKISRGLMPPPSDEVNKALAVVLSSVTSLTYEKLTLAKYKEIIPDEVLKAIASGQ